MSSVGEKLRRKTPNGTPSKQVRLKLVYIDFWSMVKLSFLIAVAVGVITIVATFLSWMVLIATNTFSSINDIASDVLGDSFDLLEIFNLGQVMSFALVIALLDVIVITALGAVVALMYNLSVRITGGLLVGFTNN
ncbi:DUF3566 domain-containing protein [Arenivirga flava]|uniref:DUF3566 domain-containing protein n=1 Tax=Arenivirga flava TaxID=1930060 RepID=A0AA37UHI6_9MICO|nr:DUF3566 domain-containing protein [Arenivirga flava]GMA29044.1 hypothetical protein GCM10025874_22970 [Arenivirga flava]